MYFDVNAAPFSFFKVSISNGERFINSANVVIDGTLIFNHSERFSFNEEHVLTIDLQDTPVRALRIEVNRQTASSLLTEIELDALGDNIAFDLLAKGGSVDVQAEVVAVAGSANVMFDGDLVSAWRVNPLAKGSSGGRATFGDYRIDLGATFLLILSGS